MKISRSIAVVVFLIFAMVTVTLAHPGFARKYRMSCNTCHQPAPKLKDFGEEFAGNAFVMEGEEPARFHPETGDDLLLLQALPPIGMRMDAYFQAYPGAEDGHVTNDFQFPYLVKFITGGRLTPSVAYYFYAYLSERGEVAGVEDAYLYFRDFLGSPIGLAVGQFQVSDPLFKRELRLTYEDYEIYTTTVGRIPLDLGYDRGFMASYTAPFGSDFVFETVNGNGLREAEGRPFDQDSFKNLFLRWSHGFPLIRIGAFGYYGETINGQTNITQMYGPDLTLSTDRLEINLQYLWRKDDNPMLIGNPGETVTTHGGLGEVIYAPRADRSRWYLIGLYNYRTSNLLDEYALNPGQFDLEYHSASLAWTYLIARNFRLLTEYNYNLTEEAHRMTVGFVSAF